MEYHTAKPMQQEHGGYNAGRGIVLLGDQRSPMTPPRQNAKRLHQNAKRSFPIQ